MLIDMDPTLTDLQNQLDELTDIVTRHKHTGFDRTQKLPSSGTSSTSASTIFGGDGSDGILSISSGTTTIDLGGAAVFIKNYSSISITGTAALTFSNPHANGTIIHLRSQGDVTITSSTSPAIDVSGLGANSANNGNGAVLGTNAGVTGVQGGQFGVEGTGGAGGAVIVLNTTVVNFVIKSLCGAGGGNGADGNLDPGTGGSGGRGGGALIIFCNGAYNVTSTLSAAGKVGANGTLGLTSNASYGNSGGGGGAGSITAGVVGGVGTGAGSDVGGGGGGGSGGSIICLYTTLTADSGTYTVTGGAGGTGATSIISLKAGDGGAGGNGFKVIAKNSFFI